MTKRWQKNITLSKEQVKYVKANKGKMNNVQIATMLGLPYQKLHNNLRLLGMVKTKLGKVIKMNNYFDVDEFQRKYYSY